MKADKSLPPIVGVLLLSAASACGTLDDHVIVDALSPQFSSCQSGRELPGGAFHPPSVDPTSSSRSSRKILAHSVAFSRLSPPLAQFNGPVTIKKGDIPDEYMPSKIDDSMYVIVLVKFTETEAGKYDNGAPAVIAVGTFCTFSWPEKMFLGRLDCRVLPPESIDKKNQIGNRYESASRLATSEMIVNILAYAISGIQKCY